MRELDSLAETKLEARDKDTMSLSACLNRIRIKVSSDLYTPQVAEELKGDFDYVRQKMGLCYEEAAILSCVLEYSNSFHSCDDEDIAQFMGCTNIEFISFRKYLEALSQKRIVRMARVRGNYAYIVLKEAYQAIVEDREFSEKDFGGLNTEEMFSQMRKAFKSFRDEEITEEMLLQDLNMLVDMNPQNIFSQKIVDSGIRNCPETEQRIFYYLCHRYVSFGDKYMQFNQFDGFIPEYEDGQRFFRHFQSGRLVIQQNGLICFGGEDGLMDKGSAGLSDTVKETFFTEVDLFCEERIEGHQDMMKAEDIVAREMFYNAPEQEQVTRLENLMDDGNFTGIQKRLEEMGMRKSFNIILYGGPGVGKTETTLQLAKKTGRDIFFIDMSKLKSKWVGESEKSVKAVFKMYKAFCQVKKKKPILFFNEADAIFGKRMENVESSVAQMLNTLQNIILQEMENLDGIMICTTNLHGNLDPAFERRFLYKIELEKPGEEVRSRIWKSMMSGLSDEDYAELARRYLFSGGQIENVVRKSVVDYILSGVKPSLESVCRFCDEESFRSKVKKVGF